MGALTDKEAAMRTQGLPAATTLVWIDREEAIIVRWADRADVERIRGGDGAEDPGHGRHRHDAASHQPGGDPEHALEHVRREHLRRFLAEVRTRVPEDGDVVVVGPGRVRERLEHELRADDRAHGRHRSVRAAPSERMTEGELVARVRELAGDAPRRTLPD